MARRKGATYYVTLIDGALSAAERRGAQLNIAVGSLEVAARTEENLAGRKAHTLDAARAEQLLAFAESTRKLANVPGVALAVVQGGKLVLEKGLGVRELGKNNPVTPTTLFMIGSMTKPLTSLMMARLVDGKQFAWDTPGHEVVPVVCPRRSHCDRKGDDGPYRMRLHRAAPVGHGVHLRIEAVEPGVAD